MDDEIDDIVCVCGDPASHHIDGEEQCVESDCGCRQFEADLPDDE